MRAKRACGEKTEDRRRHLERIRPNGEGRESGGGRARRGSPGRERHAKDRRESRFVGDGIRPEVGRGGLQDQVLHSGRRGGPVRPCDDRGLFSPFRASTDPAGTIQPGNEGGDPRGRSPNGRHRFHGTDPACLRRCDRSRRDRRIPGDRARFSRPGYAGSDRIHRAPRHHGSHRFASGAFKPRTRFRKDIRYQQKTGIRGLSCIQLGDEIRIDGPLQKFRSLVRDPGRSRDGNIVRRPRLLFVQARQDHRRAGPEAGLRTGLRHGKAFGDPRSPRDRE